MRKNAETTRGRPFEEGNPGRPKGSRNKATLAAQELLDGEAQALTRKAIEVALGGDTTALRLCLERIAPPRRECTLSFELPDVVAGVDGVPSALAKVIGAVAAGELTPGEGRAMSDLLDKYRQAVESAELELRFAALEEQIKNARA